jgi:hypothetical protein
MSPSKSTVLMFLCVLAAALTANAQTTKVVEVVFECEVVQDELTVILDGAPIRATRIRGTNRWSGDRARSFDANGRIASVRVNGAGTGCARSRAVRKPGTDQWVAEVTFRCVQQDTWARLRIETTPAGLPVTYARVIPGSMRCDETSLIKGSGALFDVAPHSEMVYLHLGALPRYYELYYVRVAPGTFGKRLAKHATLTLDSKKVIDDIAIRGGRNVANWRDLTRKDLDETGFKNLVLKVQ